ncbi:MAG: hypothetical protein K5739_07555 [Lachnospiraceae bacterium]|nr:hypothetical protein [Lachnospiraceae bacterium]
MMKKKGLEKNTLLPAALVILTILALAVYTLFFLNHLMHSDMAAEVNLSHFLAQRGELISKEWFYSTEIRILYSQLIMTPLFHIFSDYHTVKVISVFLFLAFLLLSYAHLARRFSFSKQTVWLVLLFLMAPWSNEYLDMMFLGNFYTSQTILMFVMLAFFMKEEKEGEENKSQKAKIASPAAFCILSLLMGLSGLRYLACLFGPLILAKLLWVYLKGKNPGFVKEILMTGFALAGFLIHKLYLAKNFSFDATSEVVFVPLSEVPERLLTAFRLMLELFGYREGLPMMSPLGLVNVVKCAFFCCFVYMIVAAFKEREQLSEKERLFLYYFLFLFLINLYMLVFTGVLLQYRYWIPVFIVGIFIVGMYLEKHVFAVSLQKPALILALSLAAASSLYGELWQDVKFDDCAKREGYMAFLEKEGYTFGYATFWNGPVTEYLSNGRIRVGNLGADAKPYEWLTPKSYYQKGYHKGKTFLLLARTEEAGMLKGDFTVMEDGKRVYADEYYAVYEGKGMYLFSDDTANAAEDMP